MDQDAVLVSEDCSFKGLRTVVLENSFLRVTVFPELGAKIYDLIYKPLKKNLLWHNPRIAPRKVPFGGRFDDAWCGGWDEIFPNDAASVVEGESYPDMGEIWPLEWDCTVTREAGSQPYDSATLVTSTYSPITPCKITRYLTLRKNESNIHLQYVLENVGYSTVKFLWKLHPAFDINESCTIEIPAKTGIVDPRYRSLYSESSYTYGWPNAIRSDGKRADLSRVPPPSDRTCSLHYVTDLEDGWFMLRNPKEKMDVKFTFPKDVLNSVWLFLAYGGWRSLYTAVIEPSTSYPYDLAQAIKEGRYSKLDPSQKLTCNIEVEVSST